MWEDKTNVGIKYGIMKTIDLKKGKRSLADLLSMAKRESVLIHSPSGEDYLLEQADDFDREVAALGGSDRFMSFLSSRSQEKDDKDINAIRKKRGI